MLEIAIHGRGGQGAVTAAELLASAAFCEGKYSQAFPFFGSERRGAPVAAFVRIDDKPILLHSGIADPDFVIIQDQTLLNSLDLRGEAKKGAGVLINTEKKPAALKFLPAGLRIKTAPATQIALDILGKPIVNTVLLGAFIGAFKLLKPQSLEKAVKERFAGEILEKNLKAMKAAYCHANPKDKYCYSAKGAGVKIDDLQKLAVKF